MALSGDAGGALRTRTVVLVRRVRVSTAARSARCAGLFRAVVARGLRLGLLTVVTIGAGGYDGAGPDQSPGERTVGQFGGKVS
jgi:hypothetical protein